MITYFSLFPFAFGAKNDILTYGYWLNFALLTLIMFCTYQNKNYYAFACAFNFYLFNFLVLMVLDCRDHKDRAWEEGGASEEARSEEGWLCEDREEQERGWKVGLANDGCFPSNRNHLFWDHQIKRNRTLPTTYWSCQRVSLLLSLLPLLLGNKTEP